MRFFLIPIFNFLYHDRSNRILTNPINLSILNNLSFSKPKFTEDVDPSAKILVWTEQGIGDEVIFLGLIPEVLAQSESVTVYVDKRLFALCKRSMIGAL